MILVTGATGKLGRLIVQGLLEKGIAASSLAALARTPPKASDLASRGVQVRQGDYADPKSLEVALGGVDRLMFVSSSELGARAPGHRNVIAAAKKAGVKHILYTSVLNADRSPMELAADHRSTEAALRESGVPFTLLRNGWYFENYTENLGSALEHGVVLGAAGDGRYAMATRKDYADAAVAVLTSTRDEGGKIYELGGAPSVSLSELALEVGRQANTSVAYVNLPVAEYEQKLQSFGLPPFIAHLLADSDAAAARGFLDTSSGDLQRLIGRVTTSLADAVRAALSTRTQSH
jgi:NAD(P)H dehydrogenase (quinone)